MYKPYDPDAAIEIADTARESLGDLVPTDPEEIKKYTGYGWWNHDLDAAEKLMLKAECTEIRRHVAMPDGSPFNCRWQKETPERWVAARRRSSRTGRVRH